jgi:glycosyltransferase involved in cell wall biosynthesis
MLGWLKFPGKTASICRCSAQVVVGNSYLAAFAQQHNDQVTVIPSSVDIDRYRPRHKPAQNGRLVLGWMGSSTSQRHLEDFAPVLREILARNNVEVRVVSDREPVMPGVPFSWHPWSAENEIEELARFDIGIMPIPDNRWARGKCAMKALLYMSMGVPVICSAVGTNRDVIVDGQNGFLAETTEDWVRSLEALVADADLRQRLGGAGRLTVERYYSTEHCAAEFGRVVERALHSRRATVARIHSLSQVKEESPAEELRGRSSFLSSGE